MPGITEMLERVATSKGINWAETLEELKKKGQWHVEPASRAHESHQPRTVSLLRDEGL
ncbi:hypothetical protein T492DRAFT_878935 [Pavlovales sp. CCMP2436]|nr:hypothetical protein T492DRAFT_878935 [Pavlovales sp. CCMP2436]